MAKQKFTIAQDIMLSGDSVNSVKRGSPIELDARDGQDAAMLHNLLSSNRIVEVDDALKSLEEASKALPPTPAPAAPAAPETKPQAPAA